MQLVSIVLCTYNGEKYISSQLDSIINQTYSNTEIIIADDNSTDNTLEIIKQYAQKNTNIRVFNFQDNVGYIKNFERGIAQAKGNYIALSDQDDWWYPNKIEVLLDNIGNNHLIYCNSEFTDENLKTKQETFLTKKNLIQSNNPLDFVMYNCVSGHAMLFKKDLFEIAKPFPLGIPHDWWIAFCASFSLGVSYYNEILVKYRHHQNNALVNKKTKTSKKERNNKRKHRVKSFYLKCPKKLKEKLVLKQLHESYKSFSFLNNIKRVTLFIKHKKHFFRISKKSNLSKNKLIANMFFKIK